MKVLHYNSRFFKAVESSSVRSAEFVVPLMLEIGPVNSVVDVGCGSGAWLAAFQKFGVSDSLGIDGHVEEQDLVIDRSKFLLWNLEEPLTLDRKFDLAISLEVAEHLKPSAASTFVRSLTALSDQVLFSAAIPYQGGERHLNEQWPSYWADLFLEEGFVAIDYLRPRIWSNLEVSWWYAQNCLLFVRQSSIGTELAEMMQPGSQLPLNVVHPRLYLKRTNILERAIVGYLPPPVKSLLQGLRRALNHG